MGSVSDESALVAIVGQTASGKSSLALSLAEKFNGEIICADSRTVYKGMDIGTAKPSTQDRMRIPHHLLDIVEPNQPFTAADFKREAIRAIEAITSRGKIPFLVGGSGLYIDAVLFDFSFRSQPDATFRQQLLKKTVEELQEMLRAQNVLYPNNASNPRHLIRQIETKGTQGNRGEMRSHTVLIGTPLLDREELERRLISRLNFMIEQGLEQEVRKLEEIYGWDCPAMLTIGYQEFRSYFRGEASLVETKAAIISNSLQYAKRQKTWFKRNKHINWICKKDDAVALITSVLNKNYIA